MSQTWGGYQPGKSEKVVGNYFKMKFNQKNNLYLVNVDVSASTEAFLETVCLI